MLPLSLNQESSAKIQALFSTKANLEKELAEATTKTSVLAKDFTSLVDQMKEGQKRIEVHEKASLALKELIRNVSTENISQVETLVNSALSAVMPDSQLQFRILTTVKRGLTEYEFAVIRPGQEDNPGTLETQGGGVYALVATVLKITFNILTKKAPLILLDESLSFVSEQYLLPTSTLIKQLSEQFGVTVVLVSHQPLFNESSNASYLLSPHNGETTVKKLK